MPEHPDECKYMLATYGDTMTEWILEVGDDPEEICAYFNLCSPT